MLIKNTRIKTLLLALISLNVGYTYATGVIDIPSDATAAEIAAAKLKLSTPTNEGSLYELEEVADNTEAETLSITKYLYDSSTHELTSIQYNVVFDPITCGGVSSYFYNWVLSDTGLDLDTTSLSNADISVYTSETENWWLWTALFFEKDLVEDLEGFEPIEYIASSVDGSNICAIYQWIGGSDINHSFIGLLNTDDCGGAIYNLNSSIGDITGNFIHNRTTSSSTLYGGAIANTNSSIDNIVGSFIGNYVYSTSVGEGGAISNYASIIKDITGDFIGNYVYSKTVKGGAISNNESSTIGDITGDFIGNYVYGITAKGGAISNHYSSTIGDITGDFIGNYAYASSDQNVYGGAIYNSSYSVIGDITGDFINNYVYYSCSGYSSGYGGAIFNNYYSVIGDITGDFIGNYIDGTSFVYGGAISNYYSVIGDITGNFIGNYACSESGSYWYYYGGAIYNGYGVIGNIVGDFIGNSVTSTAMSSTSGPASYGGAIANCDDSTIGDITGDFIENNAHTGGGAICNMGESTIGNITGDFIGNYVNSEYTGFHYTYGGAIYNTGTIGDITGDFIENYSWSNGGAIANRYGGVIGDIIGDFIGNYVIEDQRDGGAIYNDDSTIGNITGDFIENVGSAIWNSGEIGNIVGDFIDNYAKTYGAIYNTGTLGDITGDFIGNEAFGKGSAIYNSGTLGNIVGDFTNNTANSHGTIYNSGTIGNITGDFTNNTASYGGSIYNIASGVISSITGNFIDNSASLYGAAIYNLGEIGTITGDFIDNTVSSLDGAAIYNEGTIGDIIGDFLSNTARVGGAINNTGTIGDITGDFIDNTVSTYGGAIYNSGTIGNITGDFIGSYVSSSNSSATGSAIYNDGTIGVITGNFIGNTTSSTSGAAIYNKAEEMFFAAAGQDMEMTGNTNGNGVNVAIYNDAYATGIATVNLDAYDTYKIIINDRITGGSSDTADQIININISEGASSTVEFNNRILYQTINVYQGTLVLGENEGGVVTLTGVDADADGVDDTMTVTSSTALLYKSVLNIEADATVNTKADYLGSSNTITNLGTLNITGGALSQNIGGTGTINLFEDVTKSSTMTVAADSTLNNYGTLTANLSVAEGADVNAIITYDNLGETIFNGSISGITSMDVSFDLSLDLNDVLGTTTTVYANESDGIALTLVNSDHISGASVVGNAVVVNNQIEISTDEYTASVSKDGDATNIEVTSGSFAIAEGETQTLSNITTSDSATVAISGGTLVTDNDITLANDEATSGIKAESGVIESTATVQLSEGTTSVAAGETLEVKAAVSLDDGLNTTWDAHDASLILQGDVTIGEDASLTLAGNVSGSANISGTGNSVVTYTGTYSPGNSPELVTVANITANYAEGSTLVMEIFGDAGAGADGGHDMIVYTNATVNFDGVIQISLADMDTLTSLAVASADGSTLTFDLFDFDSDTSVSFTGEVVLDYSSAEWLVSLDTSNLFSTGEVSLSFTMIPEPSTATLSLLALTAMLARRRRRCKA